MRTLQPRSCPASELRHAVQHRTANHQLRVLPIERATRDPVTEQGFEAKERRLDKAPAVVPDLPLRLRPPRPLGGEV